MPEVYSARLNDEGRLVIPAGCRKQLGLRPGQELFLEVKGDGLHLYTREQSLKRLQEWVAAAVPPGVSMVDDLIAERRDEARKEAGE